MNQSELEAVVLQLQETTPTLEEQWFAIGVQGWVDSAGNITRSVGGHRTTIMVAPVACRILSVVSSFEYFACPASDTDYWSIGLEKGSGTSFPNITTKSTQVTGANANGGIVGRTAWSFDSGNWGNADLAQGQLLALNFTRTGSAPNILYPATHTVRYRPL